MRPCLAAILGLIIGGCCAPRCGTRHAPVAQEAPQVFLDMSVARIPEGRIDEVLGDARPTSGQDAQMISARRAQALRAAWQASEDVRVIDGPKMLALDEQEASMFIGETIVHARTEQDCTQVSPVEEGRDWVGQSVRATPHVRSGTIALDFRGAWRELIDADPSRIREIVIEAGLDLSDGGWALVGGPEVVETTEDGRVLQVVLIQARIVGPRAMGIDYVSEL